MGELLIVEDRGLVAAWAASVSTSGYRAIACTPSRFAEAVALAGRDALPIVMCIPHASIHELVSDEAVRAVDLRADAYASEPASLAAAVRFVTTEDRAARLTGAPRLTYLGSLGDVRPPFAPRLGDSVPIAPSVLIGRSAAEGGINLRQGAHSDQNTVARHHARVTLGTNGVVRVEDLRSTNGTYVNGERVSDAEVRFGAELAFAWTHRFRVDGAP